jgi:DNA-binding PadR family transcriptional regulator
MRPDDLMKEIPTMNPTHDHDTDSAAAAGFGRRGHHPFGRRAEQLGFGPEAMRSRHGGFGPRGGGHFGPGFGGFGPGFGPGGRGSRARKGDVRSAILSLLGEAPASGYGLMKAIAEKTQDAWRPSPGSIYPTLAQLVDEQLIEPTDPSAPRSDFRLTDAGREYVTEHAEQLDAAWTQSSDDEHGQLRGSAMKLMGALRQIAMTGTPEQTKRAAEKIDELRRELYAILGE